MPDHPFSAFGAHRRIAIAGGGIGGLVCAVALARAISCEIHLYEQATAFTIDSGIPVDAGGGAGIQLSPNAMCILNALEVDFLPSTLCFPHAATFYDWRGKLRWQIPLADDCQRRYGAFYGHIHRADLHCALLRAAQKLGVFIHMGSRVRGYALRADSVTVILEAGHDEADLLIAADGVHSSLRLQMTGIAPRYSGYRAWRSMIPASACVDVALRPNACLWMGAARHVIAYHVRGGMMVNLVIIEADEVPLPPHGRDVDRITALAERFVDAPSCVRALIEASSDGVLWGLYDHPPLARWHDQRCILLGDAAHAMLPFLAQGAAMAIEDAALLARALACESVDLATRLVRYQAHRKLRTDWMSKITEMQALLYHAPGWQMPLRNLALRLGQKIARARLDKIYGGP